MRAFLTTLVGEKRVEIKPGLNVTGRADTCEIVVNHKSVSQLHCVLSLQDGVLLVRDLDSSNGTLVNGQKVKKGILQEGDVLSIASIRFNVSFVKEDDTNIQLDGERSGKPTSSPGGRKTSAPLSAEPTASKEPKPVPKQPKSSPNNQPLPRNPLVESSDDFLI